MSIKIKIKNLKRNRFFKKTQRLPGLTWWLSGKESTCNNRRHGFDSRVGKEMITHSNILAWEIPWTEEPGGLQSIRSPERRTQLSDWACIWEGTQEAQGPPAPGTWAQLSRPLATGPGAPEPRVCHWRGVNSEEPPDLTFCAPCVNVVPKAFTP